ncbi:hypothetical protein WMF01_13355 [Sorangium sp. So ce1667]
MSERHSMRKVREVLRLKHECGRSEREIALAVAVGRSTVGEYLARAKAAGLTWEIAKELDDAEVEARLFRHVGRSEPAARAPVDFAWVHMELRRPGVTRRLLWTEYAEHAAAGGSGWRPYQYSQFCDLYEAYRSKCQFAGSWGHLTAFFAGSWGHPNRRRMGPPARGRDPVFRRVMGPASEVFRSLMGPARDAAVGI